MNSSINMIGLDKALSKLEDDIQNLTPLGNNDKEDFCISIYAKDIESLYNAKLLLEKLSIHAKSISMMPTRYDTCSFDCFMISEIFSSIHNSENINVDNICIHENNDVSNGDFYISTIRRNKDTGLMNIFSFRTFHSYYTDDE